MQFAPTDLDISITPQSVSAASARQEYGLAVNMALHLSEQHVLKLAVDAVPEAVRYALIAETFPFLLVP